MSPGLPRSIIKKYGVSKQAWRVYKQRGGRGSFKRKHLQGIGTVTYSRRTKKSKWGLCGKTGAVEEPAVVIFRPKHSRRPRTPVPDGKSLLSKNPTLPSATTGLRQMGAEMEPIRKGFESVDLSTDDRKPHEVVIKIDLPVPITITVKYGEE